MKKLVQKGFRWNREQINAIGMIMINFAVESRFKHQIRYGFQNGSQVFVCFFGIVFNLFALRDIPRDIHNRKLVQIFYDQGFNLDVPDFAVFGFDGGFKIQFSARQDGFHSFLHSFSRNIFQIVYFQGHQFLFGITKKFCGGPVCIDKIARPSIGIYPENGNTVPVAVKKGMIQLFFSNFGVLILHFESNRVIVEFVYELESFAFQE